MLVCIIKGVKQVTNIYLEEKEGHTDLVLVSENEKIVLACYEDRPLLVQRFKVGGGISLADMVAWLAPDNDE